MELIDTRRASLVDLEALYTFACSLTEKALDKERFAACFDACLSAPNTLFIVATCNEDPIGYISCHGQMVVHHCGMVFEIMELFVLNEHRNRGVGKLLLSALEEALSKIPHELLIVTSNMRRADAHRFYEANGFLRSSYKFKKAPGTASGASG